MPNHIEIAGNVKAARARKGWSQRELADRAGVARNTITNLEAGRGVHPDNLQSILSALGLTVAPSAETRSPWSPDVAITLNVIGIFLEQLEVDERAEWVERLTKTIIGG